jgi:hypothetical protein
VSGGSHDPRRWTAQLISAERRASRTAFGTDIDGDGVAERYPLEREFPLQELNDMSSGRVDGSRGARRFAPLPHGGRRLVHARCARSGWWKTEAGCGFTPQVIAEARSGGIRAYVGEDVSGKDPANTPAVALTVFRYFDADDAWPPTVDPDLESRRDVHR